MKTPKVFISEVKAAVEEVTVDDLMVALTQPDIILIDVRESEEYKHGHINGSVNFPRGMLEAKICSHPLLVHHCEEQDAINDLAQRSVYLICKTGGRSALAAKSLTDMGHKYVFSVAGGMDEWQRKQLPLSH